MEANVVYNIIKDNYSRVEIFEENKLKPRSYFIPFSSRKKAETTDIKDRRRESNKIVLLNGEWDFAFFNKFSDVPKNFDSSIEEFNKILVPSCWQMLDYEPHCYLQSAYQFACKPPHIPISKSTGSYRALTQDEKPYVQYNSVGIYRKKFAVNKSKKEVLISFLGVAGCLELYCNGQYVGYSEGSHNTAEFNLTSALYDGDNEILVVVHKWCNGSYLESQDMFRMNGIFRDVYLTVNNTEYIYDFNFNTIKINGKYNASVSIKIINNDKSSVNVSIEDNGKIIAQKSVYSSEDVKVDFFDLPVEEWSAEIPKCYSLYITLFKDGMISECIRKEVGFRNIEVTEGKFVFNEELIKLKGVNYHDSSPTQGYYLSKYDYENDLLLMKSYNINAIRCANYPKDPIFYELATLIGFYVVDEADIESNGSYSNYVKKKKPELISDNAKFLKHFEDRVIRMYEKSKNESCVILYSIANDSGYGKCLDNAYNKLKSINYNTPIFYPNNTEYESNANEIVSFKFITLDELNEVSQKTFSGNKRIAELVKANPAILIDFASGKGAGAGNLEEYVNMISSAENILGGFISDFADQIEFSFDNFARYRDIYGGDSGEFMHDGINCLRGIFYPDRKPKPSALSVKHAYRPIKASLFEKQIILKNTEYFKDSKGLNVKIQAIINGEMTKEVTINEVILPRSNFPVNINIPDTISDIFFNVIITDENGAEISFEQLTVKERLLDITIDATEEISVLDFARQSIVYFRGGFIEFDKRLGAVIKYNVNGVDYIKTEPLKKKGMGSISTEIFRAPMANDDLIKDDWYKAEYHNFKLKTEDFDIIKEDNLVYVIVKIDFVNSKGDIMFIARDRYTVHANGRLDIDCSLEAKLKGLPPLPRFGKQIQMQYDFQLVEYYGRGERENYSDMKEHAPIGIYSCEVNDFYEPYIKPQEAGNREDVRYAIIKNRKGAGLLFLAQKQSFSLNAQYSESQKIDKFTHREDYKTESTVYISIDGYMRGVGGREWKRESLKELELNPLDGASLQFSIIPLSIGIKEKQSYAKIKNKANEAPQEDSGK